MVSVAAKYMDDLTDSVPAQRFSSSHSVGTLFREPCGYINTLHESNSAILDHQLIPVLVYNNHELLRLCRRST